jgi:hypothetical protein
MEKDRTLRDQIVIGMVASYKWVLLVGGVCAVAATAPTQGCQGPLSGRRGRGMQFWVLDTWEGSKKNKVQFPWY